MKRFVLGGAAALSLSLLSPALSDAAALYPQCPAAGADSGCQYLVVATDGGQQLLSDAAQGPYDGTEDALIGVQNNSSAALSQLPLSSPGSSLFGFEADGICNPGTGLAAPGCVYADKLGDGTTVEPLHGMACAPAGAIDCAFPPPPGEGPNFTEPGQIVAVFNNGDQQTGYEGPTSWFTNVSADTTSGVVRFSPPIPPGGSTFFGLEEPPQGNLVIGAPSTITSTTLSGGGQSGVAISAVQGTAVTDQANVSTSSGVAPTGTVSYAVFGDPGCGGKVADAGTGAVAPSGLAGPSSPVTLPAGKYYFQASYNGDSQNAKATSACNEVLTVLAPTTTTTTLRTGAQTGASLTVAAGTRVSDVAHIAGPLAPNASGTVTYAVFKDAACTVRVAAAGTGALAAGGNAAASAPQNLPAGRYYWQASYGGDATNAPSTSACGAEILRVASPSKKIGLPKAKKCRSRRAFVIHVRVPKGEKPASGEVYINRKLAKSVIFNGRRASKITLKGLPKGRYLVTVFITTQSGKSFTDHRRYRTCAKKRRH